jgi:Domain of unknown function (DUF4383)
MHFPEDHKLSKVYRVTGALVGVALIIFAVLGYMRGLGPFSTERETVLALGTSGWLTTLSLVVGIGVLAGAIIGGNTASWANVILGSLFILSGVVHLVLQRTTLNFFNFRMSNVIFSFVVGLILLTAGMYGRVSASLPPESPYSAERRGERAGAARSSDDVRDSYVGSPMDADRGVDGDGSPG